MPKSKFLFFFQGSCWVFLFYLDSWDFTIMHLSVSFFCTNSIFSPQTWVVTGFDFIFFYSSFLFLLYFHSETHNWRASKVLDLTSLCLSFSIVFILLLGLPRLVMGREVVQSSVGVWNWFVLLVWELLVPLGLCYIFGAWISFQIWTDTS